MLIFYANETTPAAATSNNYTVLLAALRDHDGRGRRDAQALADAIEEDARVSPAIARHEADALLRACGRVNASIAVFTNELVMGRHFRFCGSGTLHAETLPFPDLPPSSDPLLNLTPLARPDYLQAALEQVALRSGGRPLDALLLTDSHGGIGMALMPRVSANVMNLDSATLAKIWDLRGSKPSWAALKGTTKSDYWRVLGEVSHEYPIRFALVVRQACESGIESLAEFRRIPDSVGLIAHTAMADLAVDKIDYDKLSAAAATASDPIQAIATNLAAQGMHVDGRPALLLWLVPVYLWSLPPILFLLPLALWIGWVGWTAASGLRRVAPERAHPAIPVA